MTSSFSKYTVPLIFAMGLLFFLSPFYSQHVYAATTPTLVILSHATEFDFNDCTSATVAGKNFTHSGTAVFTSLGNLSATPSRVSIGFDGNFEAKVNLCYTGFTGDNSGRLVGTLGFTITATDATTGDVVTTTPVAIIDPTPRIQVASRNVPLLSGCATVRITGDHFVASGLANNYVWIRAYRIEIPDKFRDDRLFHQPYQINVLGGGKIAISVPFCGLTPGEPFFLYVQDAGSYNNSSRVIIHTY